MSIPALLIGSLLVAVCIFMILTARKRMAALKNYEVEHRSAKGVVEFSDIEASQTHTADKGLYTVMGIVGFFVGVFGVLLLVAGSNLG